MTYRLYKIPSYRVAALIMKVESVLYNLANVKGRTDYKPSYRVASLIIEVKSVVLNGD